MDLGGGNAGGGGGGSAAKRLDAIKLAKGSKWDELKRLVDAEPLTAQQTDSYGMLPLHWACTEPHSIGEGVLMSLLKAYPQGSRVVNTAEMLPLQIAIKAQAKIEWLQALLASYPDAVLKKTPTGENALELARKANLPARSVRLLEEMYHHVCQKAGYSSDHLYEESGAQDQMSSAMVPLDDGSSGGMMVPHDHQQQQQLYNHRGLRSVGSSESLLRYGGGTAHDAPPPAPGGGGPVGSSRGGGAVTFAAGNRMNRRPSNPDTYKSRTHSENDYQLGTPESMYPSYVRGASTSSAGSGSGSAGGSGSAAAPPPGVSLAKPLPYQVSTQLSQRTVVSLPPRWTNAPNCHICSQKFYGAFRKRHHCRNCGQSICSDHSARERMKLPHYGLPDRYRVCTVCHQTLRNASSELLQPSQGRVTNALPARRSDEALQRRDSAGQVSMSGSGSNGIGGGMPSNSFQLERHVSAPARSIMGTSAANTEYHGIHDQVASLQKQVSLLMEEKELAETQLRAQAELLGEPYSAERPTGSGLGRRERLNSVPVKNSGGGNSFVGQQHPSFHSSSYDMGSRVTRSTASSDEMMMREREVDVAYGGAATATNNSNGAALAMPEPPMEPSDMMAHLQDDMGKMSFMSSYSEFDDRSTELYGDLSATTGMHLDHGFDVQEGDEEEGAMYNDDDDDDDDDVGDSTLPEVEVLVNLGLSMLNKGSTSAAVQAFTRAVEICPDTAMLYSYLAKAHYADENLDEAVEALETSLQLELSAANSTLLGKILFEKGDHEKAIMAYQKSLEYQNA